ncbi:MAG: polyprenyl synthetase family protein [Oscillospiraceae bacterium]|nr:polyprenyl synthetase family protein [Oscillospiraceae bacterium]
MMSRVNDDMLDELRQCKAMVDERLRQALPGGGGNYSTLLESMRYSLLDGGKRIRAALTIKFCEAAGGKPGDALNAACAIEMLHSYTLIHDDLPCMDDDGMRRGKPSNHIAYGEFTAMLAGDALQAAAFESLLNSELPPERVVKMAKVLAKAAGAHGVCGGQYLDLSGEGKEHTKEELLEIYSMKTTALFSASAQMGVFAGGGTDAQAAAAVEYSKAVGLAFQARDDILDCTSTERELGKPIGSDAENQKTTLASLLGIEKCEELVEAETEKAIYALKGAFERAEFLKTLVYYLASRNY